MKEILEIKNVSKKYQHKNGETLAIQGINLKVNDYYFSTPRKRPKERKRVRMEQPTFAERFIFQN